VGGPNTISKYKTDFYRSSPAPLGPDTTQGTEGHNQMNESSGLNSWPAFLIVDGIPPNRVLDGDREFQPEDWGSLDAITDPDADVTLANFVQRYTRENLQNLDTRQPEEDPELLAPHQGQSTQNEGGTGTDQANGAATHPNPIAIVVHYWYAHKLFRYANVAVSPAD